MRRTTQWVLLGSLLSLAACAHVPAGDKPAKLPSFIPSFQLPSTISEASCKAERDVYDALPVNAPRREQFRALLLGHLLKQLEQQLARANETEALRSFVAAATLYQPTEVYAGKLREPRLAALARRLAGLFSPRGDEENVVLLLAVQMTLGGEEAALKQRIQEIVGWVDETQQLVHGGAAKGAQLLRVFEKTSRSWPSRFVVETLHGLYLERKLVMARTMGGETFRNLRLALPTLMQGTYFQTGYRIARLFLRVDRPYDALTRIRELGGEGESETELRQLLEQAVSPSANVKDQIRLAEHFEERERDRDVALRVCQAATLRFPDHAAAFECVGRLAGTLNRHYLSVVSLERAVQLSPDQLSYAEALARQYQRRLFDLIGDEQLDHALRETGKISGFYTRTELRFKAPLKPSLSRVYYAIGHGYFNAGRVDRAAAAFERSIAAEATPDALIQLALIRLKKSDAAGALGFLDRAAQGPVSSPAERIFWRGRIEGLRGRAHELAGKTAESRTAHQAAIAAWGEWQALGLRPEARAEAYVYEAQSRYELGEKSRALDTLERAIDAQPDRKETYADAIAMLITHGHLPEALDALHRALGRAEVSEYLKTYCSFWVIGLARRAGLPPDGLALAHLKSLQGQSWYVKLADLILGKVTYEALLKDARSVGNRAELYYYWADHLLAQGKVGEAQQLWRKVLETDMMGFYEYEMSSFNLRKGAAPVTTRPLDRQPSP